jgi:hypothetical protein
MTRSSVFTVMIMQSRSKELGQPDKLFNQVLLISVRPLIEMKICL